MVITSAINVVIYIYIYTLTFHTLQKCRVWHKTRGFQRKHEVSKSDHFPISPHSWSLLLQPVQVAIASWISSERGAQVQAAGGMVTAESFNLLVTSNKLPIGSKKIFVISLYDPTFSSLSLELNIHTERTPRTLPSCVYLPPFPHKYWYGRGD